MVSNETINRAMAYVGLAVLDDHPLYSFDVRLSGDDEIIVKLSGWPSIVNKVKNYLLENMPHMPWCRNVEVVRERNMLVWKNVVIRVALKEPE